MTNEGLFFIGFIFGFFCCLMFLYIIRREKLQKANVSPLIKKTIINDPFYVEVKTGKYYFRSDLIKEYGRKELSHLLAQGIFVNESFYEKEKRRK